MLRILAEDVQIKGCEKRSLFFKKCTQINAPSGELYYNVAAADLIDILLDHEMRQLVLVRFVKLLPDAKRLQFLNDWQEHFASRGNRLSGQDEALPLQRSLKISVFRLGYWRGPCDIYDKKTGVYIFSFYRVRWEHTDRNGDFDD